MRKGRLSKWLVALGLGAVITLGIKAPVDTKAAYPGTWEQTAEGWKYQYHDNTGETWYASNNFVRIGDGKKYYFNDDGIMQTGWIQRYNYWYYASASGEIQTGWQTIDGTTYYFYKNGAMAKDTTIDMKWKIDENGVYVGRVGEWKSDSNGWWYQYADGTYPKDTIEYIDRYRYAFGEDGYMYTGWTEIDYEDSESDWIYSAADGRLVCGWQQIDGTWYYFYSGGYMAMDTTVDGKYKVGKDGAMLSTVGTWKQDGSKWWYSFEREYYDCVAGEYYEGAYPKNTMWYIDGQEYYFDSDGYMMTGWIDIGKTFWGSESSYWAYVYPDGSVPDYGWQQIDGTWYFFWSEDGSIATNTAIDGYWFDENGGYKKYTEEYEGGSGTWKSDSNGWWYEEADGYYYSSGYATIDGCRYAFDNDGYMLTGWVDDARYYDYGHQEEPIWYYFESDGKAAQGWKQIDGAWYFFSNGRMNYDTYIGNYYLGHDGKLTDKPNYVEW